jgi:diguanylate cyclase (GGDEF)-like protein/PAS domain S-box-containing protein
MLVFPKFPASFHEKLLDSLYDGVYFVDKDRRITYWNHGAETLTGYSATDAVGRNCFENFLEHVDEQGCALCLNGCPLTSTMGDGQRREAEVYLRHKNGHRVPVSVRVAPLRDAAGLVVGAVEIFTDVSEKKKVERRVGELENLAFCDSLTGLLNRRFVELKVTQAILEHQEFGRNYGLLMIDVDRFKQVNDTVGHDAGDAVLRAVSQTLVQSLRALDIVGRWGGEEFLALLADPAAATLHDLAERCRRLVAESSVIVNGERLAVTVSVGGTLINRSDSASSAVRRADHLMYQSKAAGRNRSSIDE